MTLVAQLINWTAKLLKALWLFFAGVASVGAIYYLFTGVEQGVDVVIQSGELLDSGVLTTLAVFLWSFLVWYSSRTLSYIKQHKDDEIFSKKTPGDTTSAKLYEKYCIPSSFYQHIPRLLAFNCFVSVQVAIFRLPTFFNLTNAVMILVILAQNVFYFLLIAWFNSNRGTKRQRSLSVINPLVIAAYTTFLVSLIMGAAKIENLAQNPIRHMFWLSVIALAMFVLEVVIVFFFVARRRTIDARRKDQTLQPSRILRAVGFNPAFNAAEAPYFNLLNGTAAVAVIVYVLAIFVMPFADVMGPMAFALLALGVLTGFSNLITLISIRTSFNVSIILIALAVIFGQYRDPYSIRLLDERPATFADRPEIKSYLGKWFAKRQALIEGSAEAKFPVYIILSNGGASRAGYWTSNVLSDVQDKSYRADPDNSFKDHVLCIAGASGGSVGNCAFYSLLRAEQQGEIKGGDFSTHSQSFFETDFLTFTLARLLGPDILRHLIPFDLPLDNRADALEKVISNGSRDTLLNRYFARSLHDVFDTSGDLPILFINTTQVDNGMPGLISSVKLPQYSLRTDVLSLVDSMGPTGLRLSTAAVLSSRFPYVSPAGKVFDRYYVDGGYFDNSGAGTVLEFIRELNAFLTDTTNETIVRYRDRLTFHIVHITNSEVLERPSPDIHPLTNDLLSPLLTLAGMQGSSTDIGNGILINAFKQFNTDTANALIVYSLYDQTWDLSKRGGEYEEGYPMSWTLSAYQMNRMKAALRRANATNLRKLGYSDRD